ncbi:MAG: hypothetical protein M0Z34_01180 [Nitrospiraceae bacterium]|nr:hypothetical protein [Nitrospiraceae bacterium]
MAPTARRKASLAGRIATLAGGASLPGRVTLAGLTVTKTALAGLTVTKTGSPRSIRRRGSSLAGRITLTALAGLTVTKTALTALAIAVTALAGLTVTKTALAWRIAGTSTRRRPATLHTRVGHTGGWRDRLA